VSDAKHVSRRARWTSQDGSTSVLDQLYVLELLTAERQERLRAAGRKHALRVRNRHQR
jgi:hypothetical protein